MTENINEEFQEEQEFNCEDILKASQFNNENQQYIAENIVEINKDNIKAINYNKDYFDKGIEDMSLIAGKITALVNVGITPIMALQYLYDTEANKDTLTSAESIAKINGNTNINKVKLDMLTFDKNSV